MAVFSKMKVQPRHFSWNNKKASRSDSVNL